MLKTGMSYYPNAAAIIHATRARAFAPRKTLTVSEWSDNERRLSKKGSAEPGPWHTDRNPPLREPMDCLSVRSTVKEVVMMFPIQSGKSEVALNILGYSMDHNPGPIMVCLPGEVGMNKWISQKLNPMIEETPAIQAVLTTQNSRNSSNTKEFKDFLGGQLYLEHAGSPSRLKSTSVKILIVDELTEFASNLQTGDDPLMLLEDRTSAFPSTYKRLYISSPGIKGICRTEELYEKSDQRRYFMPCPHCNEEIIFEWSGLHWSEDGHDARYVCPECACEIEEHYKTEMIKKGRWIATNPGPKLRGYHINALYYQIGLGPRWSALVDMWLQAYNDIGRLKSFLNSRLAVAWEDPSMRAVKMNVIADRVESYRLRTAPVGVCAVTAGVDTQDNRLAVQIVGWGKGMACWVLDYVELMGDPADDAVWVALTELLNKSIDHINGHKLPVLATAIDAGGHRTEAVKDYVRRRMIRRPMVIFGAIPNNAPVLSKPKAQDVNWKGQLNKRGVHIQHVGTVAVKNVLFGRLATDGDKEQNERMVHFSEDLPNDFFSGITSETFDPRANRFIKKRGARNEPLDCFVYAYAAAHHQELRLHLHTKAKWDELLNQYGNNLDAEARRTQPDVISLTPAQKPLKKPKRNSYLL
ncbi:MAG: phage terminase large subunit family protein [Methylococcaceae bacterium]|jgi:phage terminase large subunit GpA-like protein